MRLNRGREHRGKNFKDGHRFERFLVKNAQALPRKGVRFPGPFRPVFLTDLLTVESIVIRAAYVKKKFSIDE
jgi:hypothetical protein